MFKEEKNKINNSRNKKSFVPQFLSVLLAFGAGKHIDGTNPQLAQEFNFPKSVANSELVAQNNSETDNVKNALIIAKRSLNEIHRSSLEHRDSNSYYSRNESNIDVLARIVDKRIISRSDYKKINTTIQELQESMNDEKSPNKKDLEREIIPLNTLLSRLSIVSERDLGVPIKSRIEV